MSTRLSESTRLTLAFLSLRCLPFAAQIWFQNKRAKIKKTTGQKNPLAVHLMAQGLYNHTTASLDGDEEEEETVDVDDATTSSPAGNHVSVSSPDASTADHSLSSDQ